MKILVAANFDLGLYKFRKELLKALLDNGHQVYIALPKGDLVPPLVEMGCSFVEADIDRRGMNPITDLKLIFSYRKILKQVKPDFVITYTIKPNIYMGFLCRVMKIPYVVNITGLGTAFQSKGAMRRVFVQLYKTACKKAHTVIFENCANMQLFKDYGIVTDRQCLLNNGAGVNLEEYPFTEYPDKEQVRFLFIGRVMREKGMDELYAAAKRIKKEYDNVFFDIVGPYEDDYKSVTEQLVEDGVIEYHGFQENVKPFIEKSHCFVLPSWHEGMANTNLECAAMGRPIITSNIHGCLEAVIENKSGFLTEPKNAEVLYSKLKQFIELPYDKKIEMGQAAHNHIANHFDKTRIVSRTMDRVFN